MRAIHVSACHTPPCACAAQRAPGWRAPAPCPMHPLHLPITLQRTQCPPGANLVELSDLARHDACHELLVLRASIGRVSQRVWRQVWRPRTVHRDERAESGPAAGPTRSNMHTSKRGDRNLKFDLALQNIRKDVLQFEEEHFGCVGFGRTLFSRRLFLRFFFEEGMVCSCSKYDTKFSPGFCSLRFPHSQLRKLQDHLTTFDQGTTGKTLFSGVRSTHSTCG